MITKIKTFFRKLYYTSLIVLGIFALVGASYSAGYLDPAVIEKVKEIPVPTFLDPYQEDCGELVREIGPKYLDVPHAVFDVILDKESYGGKKDAVKFEAHHISKTTKITKDPEMQRMYASSWGCMQVMGWHAPRFQMTYAQLLIPRNNVEVGMSILADCFERHKGIKNKYDRYYNAFKCYNGADTYAKDAMSRVVSKLIEENL